MSNRINGVSLLEKLGRLALDQAAQPGEADSAARKFFEVLRREKVRWEQLGQTLELKPAKKSGPQPRFPWGKHAGQTPIQVIYEDGGINYLVWFQTNIERGRVSRQLWDAIEEALDKASS